MPASFRSYFGDRCVITVGFDKCLYAYSEEDWEKTVDKLNQLPSGNKNARAVVRALTGYKKTVEFDSQGRIILAPNQIKHADIKKECCIVGVGSKVEIWSKELFEPMDEETMENLSDLIEELDF